MSIAQLLCRVRAFFAGPALDRSLRQNLNAADALDRAVRETLRQ